MDGTKGTYESVDTRGKFKKYEGCVGTIISIFPTANMIFLSVETIYACQGVEHVREIDSEGPATVIPDGWEVGTLFPHKVPKCLNYTS